LLGVKLKLAAVAPEMTAFLKTVDDPENFVDIAAFNLCDSVPLKQKLLETLDVHQRLEIFSQRLRLDIETLRLSRRLQRGLPDNRVGDN
jgi:ATP-dependent Lon protease